MMINQKSPYFLYHLGRLSEIVAVFSLSSPMTPCSLPGSIIQWDVWTRSPCTLELVHPVLWHRVDFSTLESTTFPSLLPLYFNDFFFFAWTFSLLEKAMAPHSSTLAWKIPWMEEPGRLQSMGSLRVGHDWVISLSLFTFMHWRRKWQPTPVCLENPRDRGAWWAAVYGVAQIRTRLKRLSSLPSSLMILQRS